MGGRKKLVNPSGSKSVIFVISALSALRPASKLRERPALTVTDANIDTLVSRANGESAEAAALRRLVNLTKAHPGALIKLWDVTKPELLEDAQRAAALDQTVLFKRVYAEGVGSFGGNPVAVVVADFVLDPTADDLDLIGALDFVGEAAWTPILVSAPEAFEAMAGPSRTLRLEGGGNWVFQLLPRWRTSAGDAHGLWIPPAYLVAAIAAVALRRNDLADAARSLLTSWDAASSRKFAAATAHTFWDLEFESRIDDPRSEDLWRASVNFLSHRLVNEPGSLMRLRAITRKKVGPTELTCSGISYLAS